MNTERPQRYGPISKCCKADAYGVGPADLVSMDKNGFTLDINTFMCSACGQACALDTEPKDRT